MNNTSDTFLYKQLRLQSHRQTDLMFGGLLVLQLFAAVLIAITVSPRTWIGSSSHVHLHVWSALGMGLLLTILPLVLIIFRRGEPVTRYTIAIAQMLYSALLIHLMGGRIETHFHVFGSLAFLAFYRDWRVLVPATIVVSFEHLVRGIYWPESVFGVLSSTPWRALEHAMWVIFIDFFLVISCIQGDREWRRIAASHAQVENARASVEVQVKQRTAELRESEQRYALAVRGSRDGLWDWDLHANQVYYASRWKQLLGCDEDEVSDSPREWTERIISADLPAFDKAIVSLTEGETEAIDIELSMDHADGSIRHMRCRAAAVIPEGHTKAVRIAGSLSDITDLKRAQEELRRLAQHDRLTGLPNRQLFTDRVQRAILYGKQSGSLFAVLFLDFDRFKVINDSLGHEAGDELLKGIAQRLTSSLAKGDVAARFGGDEFALLMHVRTQQDAIDQTEQLLKQLAEPHDVAGHELVSTASIGVTIWSIGYEDASEMLRDADAAMYVAKQNGKSQQRLFDTHMHNKAKQRLTMEEDLRRAIKSKSLTLEYQPIISLQDGSIRGAEALARWNHDERGMISPDEFIGIAEETGLIIPIGEHFIREACEQVKRWNQINTRPLYVNVNLAQRQLIYPGLVTVIKQILNEVGVDANLLRLELSESAVMAERHDTITVMQEIRDAGIRLAMDDFGTGHSSLSSLHRYPLDILKVDRSFVQNMMRRHKFAGVMQAIVTLAHNLELEVVGEGLETPEQVAMLQSMDCDLGQGYIFARPMPGDEFIKLLSQSGMDHTGGGRLAGVSSNGRFGNDLAHHK
ncbi:putative bifunctional diguanylate cyclase/phosphodiesterase [Phycisphaerales bacterium AB-hyl4]|uniref:Bifunctional diguanylate cyclase/phosphodiesterase n=1 Tax=Natronomicrosphaera hydrolytica TaxID=3242702 RepID=A0ABV4U1U2_9BACT